MFAVFYVLYCDTAELHINLATMSRVALDETPAFEQLIQLFSWGTRSLYALQVFILT